MTQETEDPERQRKDAITSSEDVSNRIENFLRKHDSQLTIAEGKVLGGASALLRDIRRRLNGDS